VIDNSIVSYGVHVQGVHTEVEGRQVHVLEHVHEGLAMATLHVHDLPGVLLHRPLDEAQKMLLVHAGGRVYVRVHLGAVMRQHRSKSRWTLFIAGCSG